MKTQLTRLLLLLLSLMLCFGLYACAEPNDEGTGDKIPSGDQTEDPDDEKEPQILPDVEVKDYDYTLGVMHWTNEGAHEHYNPWNEIAPAEGVNGPIGDIIEDAIFDRTGWLKETYGISIDYYYQPHANIPTVVSNLIQSGSDEYQVLVEFGFDAQRVMGKNYFLDLRVTENIDLEKPWWVKESIDNLQIGEFVEFAASDLLILDKAATCMVFYNIPMADDLGISNFYQLVEDYEWTIEELADAAEEAYMDDGNDQRDEYDTFGIVCGDDPVHGLYISAGMKFIDRNEDGEYYYSYGTDDGTLDVMTTILEDVMYEDFLWNTWIYRDSVAEQPSFKKDQALFTFGMAKACNSMRDMESAYGILPMPLYDTDQEQYYSQVSGYHDSLIAIFNTAGDPAKVGAALEVLSYYSYYNIYPSFYEVVIQGRGTRDDESRDMLDLIFSTRTYDLGLVYDPNGFSDKVLRFTSTGGTDLSSFIGSWEAKLNSAMEELNELASTYW